MKTNKTINLTDLDVPAAKFYLILTQFVDAARWIKLIWVIKKTDGLDIVDVRRYADAFASIVGLYNKHHGANLNHEDPLMRPGQLNKDWDTFFAWFKTNGTQANALLEAAGPLS